MQGAPKRQVNAEEMLAELKRALEFVNPCAALKAEDVQARFPGREWRASTAGASKAGQARLEKLEADSRRNSRPRPRFARPLCLWMRRPRQSANSPWPRRRGWPGRRTRSLFTPRGPPARRYRRARVRSFCKPGTWPPGVPPAQLRQTTPRFQFMRRRTPTRRISPLSAWSCRRRYSCHPSRA